VGVKIIVVTATISIFLNIKTVSLMSFTK